MTSEPILGIPAGETRQQAISTISRTISYFDPLTSELGSDSLNNSDVEKYRLLLERVNRIYHPDVGEEMPEGLPEEIENIRLALTNSPNTKDALAALEAKLEHKTETDKI